MAGDPHVDLVPELHNAKACHSIALALVRAHSGECRLRAGDVTLEPPIETSLNDLEYRIQVTPELARAAAAPLEQALWLQNERHYEYLRSRAPFLVRFRPQLRLAGILLSLVGLALSLLGWTMDHCRQESLPQFSVAFVVFAAVFAVLGRQPHKALRRFTRRMVTRRARRMMEQVARKAPYVIEYSLANNVLTARVEELGFSRLLDLRTIRIAVKARDFIIAFTHSYSTRQMRLFYFPSPIDRDQLLQAIGSAGAELLELP